MPGVSTSRICVSFWSATPISRVRVVCALGLTIATFWPTSALTSVDLPALGAQTTALRPPDWVILRDPGMERRYQGFDVDRFGGGRLAIYRARKSVGAGKSVAVRVDLGGSGRFKKH